MGKSTKLSRRPAKRRERDAEYRQRPEVRERQRLLMAQRRADVKAWRRQWDPPKQPKRAKKQAAAPAEDDSSEGLLTPAEHLALRALAELKDRDDRRPAVQIREESASRGSSLGAVFVEPIRRPPGGGNWLKRDAPLPDFIAPETPLQKKMRHELGEIGPLTAIQQAQIDAYRLRRRSRYYEEEDPPLETAPTCLSTARWQRICDWRHGLSDFDTDWDAPVRRELEEETLRRRVLMYQTFRDAD